MIIIGYPGIGKSTIAKNMANCIDLESSNFWIEENNIKKRIDNWQKAYVNVATDLSSQGNIVFVSSHYLVREELKNVKDEFICVIYPSLDLRVGWIEKLRDRYEHTKLNKDLAAYNRVKDYYDEDIKDLMHSDFYKSPIDKIDYTLGKIIADIKLGKSIISW